MKIQRPSFSPYDSRKRSNPSPHQRIFTFLLLCFSFPFFAFTQTGYVITSCGFKVTTEVVYNSPQAGQTTFRWTIQNTNPGNGKNGTFQDLSHLCQRLNASVNPASRLSGGSYGPDKSQDCLSGNLLKFDQGTH